MMILYSKAVAAAMSEALFLGREWPLPYSKTAFFSLERPPFSSFRSCCWRFASSEQRAGRKTTFLARDCGGGVCPFSLEIDASWRAMRLSTFHIVIVTLTRAEEEERKNEKERKKKRAFCFSL